MSRKTLSVLASVVALGVAGSALAQSTSTTSADAKAQKKAQYDKRRATLEKDFKAADKNGDGGLTKDELNAVKGLSGIKKNFDAMDTNKDGKVTLAESDAWAAQNRAAAKAAKSK